MNSQEQQALKTLCESTHGALNIEVLTVGDGIGDSIAEALEGIAEQAPCIALKKKKDSDQNEAYIRIRDNITLKAKPYEKIFFLFIDLLDSVLHPERYVKGFEVPDVAAPVFLKVYIAPLCPYCPTVVKEMVKLALLSDRIYLDIIDGTLFTGKAENDGIMAAPTVICDDKQRWSGNVSALEILDVICRRKPEELSSETFRAMVEAGNASSLAGMMLTKNKIFPAFYDLLVHEKWPVRLGAMVTVETIHEKNASLSEKVIGELWDRYDSLPDHVKGDVVYLTGEVGPRAYFSKLKSIEHSDIKEDILEAVQEALEAMAERLDL